MSENDIRRLRGLIAPPGEDAPCCPFSSVQLYALLENHGSCENAAYHACLLLARDDSVSLPDGTSLPSQREYWLMRAAALRPKRGGMLRRADEVSV